MKALSLWQPWASLVVNGWKNIETRSWSTPDRGLIAIASTASLPAEGRRALGQDAFQDALFHCVPSGGGYGLRSKVLPHQLPYGAILGVAKLGDCVEMTEESVAHRREHEPLEHAFGIYKPGRFEWHFERVTKFVEPIPCRGAQKLWNVKGATADQLADRLERAGLPSDDAAQLAFDHAAGVAA